jgi:hypothetical protein
MFENISLFMTVISLIIVDGGFHYTVQVIIFL